jgi:phosphatidylinositol-3-phosphatase
VAWAQTNNSLLIVTWDEDDNTSVNQIPTIFVGPMVKPGQYSEKINHYNVLRTLEAIYGLPYAGQSQSVKTILGVWQ